MMPRVVASIEARMASSRLPGKVLSDIHGAPVLARIVNRLQRCQTLDAIVVATSINELDDEIAAWAAKADVTCYRGSEADVLRRVVEAHRFMDSDIIVEVSGDTPLIDPEVIDLGVETFRANECDVVSNTWKLSFPQGIDAQVFRRSTLEEVEQSVDDPAIREHVSLYFYEHPEIYRIVHMMAPARWHGSQYRFQLDYAEDHQFISEVYARLEAEYGEFFGTEQILELLRRQPAIAEINRCCEERSAR
jgi:spore coat polysaccharide biosynthesis protein SpsF